jgi:hypothetical protein
MKPPGEYPPHLAALLTSTIEFEKELVDALRDLLARAALASSAVTDRMEDFLLSDNFCSNWSFRISSAISDPLELILSALSSKRSIFPM